MALIILRLVPKDPVPAEDFAGYLDGLRIGVHELRLSDPSGAGPETGSAAYIAPNLPPSPGADPAPDQDADTRIVQHFGITPVPLGGLLSRTMFSVATAVVEVPDPAPGTEHETADIRLVITRNGGQIVHRRLYYNVPVMNGALPADRNQIPGLQPTSLHLQLNPPGGGTGTVVSVPEDGSAPNFAQLRAAVEDVLQDEPGNLAGIADLTLKDARHIAREITWDRGAFPLPAPDLGLERIYTGPHGADSNEERARRVFEGDLVTYYVSHDGEADRLASFVFALSAAIWCANRSAAAEVAGLVFPVFPDRFDRFSKVHLIGAAPGPLNPSFAVTAEYFYALTALLPPQIARAQRYAMAVLQSEDQLRAAFIQAIDETLIAELPALNRHQAARRLHGLGLATEKSVPLCPLTPGSAAHGLVQAWLAVTAESTETFWATLTPAQMDGHLEVALSAITHAHQSLMDAIRAPAFGVDEIGDLPLRSSSDWLGLFSADPILLPPFTAPGTLQERTEAFVRNLRHFFEISAVVDPFVPPPADTIPTLDRSPGNPVDQLVNLVPGFDFLTWTDAAVLPVLPQIFPGDPDRQESFLGWLRCMRGVFALTEGIAPPSLRFSVTEALWARGLASPVRFDGLGFQDVQDALRGSVAYNHAALVWQNAGSNGADLPPPQGVFTPVNPDGSLANCLPPEHLSPLGPIAYLKELLLLTPSATCDRPMARDEGEDPLSRLVEARRGPLGQLLATAANLGTALPLIDLVNESLEHMVATGGITGAIHDTSADEVGGHALNTAAEAAATAHDAETLFEALPEFSTPATPTAEPNAWDKLRADFAGCHLPYDQPLDITRSYLERMGTSRFKVMRHFRRDITEWVLDPAAEPSAFRRHLWRYPVRHDLALEYLGISPQEYATLYSPGGVGPATLLTQFGFPRRDADWREVILQLPEFLARTCLGYCEFRDLMLSNFVPFKVRHGRTEGLPDCEPCCINDYTLVFSGDVTAIDGLKLLNAFIRLWRRLNARGHAISFAELADIAKVLVMFNGTTANAGFPRQLAAFLMLRNDFGLPMTDGKPPAANADGAERLHLLAFWAAGSSHADWAVEQLLYAIQQYAMHRFHCGCRPPESLRLLRENLDDLSRLAGFDPDSTADHWRAHPTHTLRFAEILAKIYASDFEVGELLFLFTVQPQLQGDEPFPLQTLNEARDIPFDLPDDQEAVSLFALRQRLRSLDSGDAGHLTWPQMGRIMHDRFGMPMAPDSTIWSDFGRHFFPGMTGEGGDPAYSVPLAATSAELWNTGGGPFRFDPVAKTLGLRVGFTDSEVLAKLSRIRQMTPAEAAAVRTLYFLPRGDLAFFGFLFDDQVEADQRLIQEADEGARWDYFRAALTRFVARADAIATHLAEQTAHETGQAGKHDVANAMLLLKSMHATENFAETSWEDDSGDTPAVHWTPQPNGGAFHALTGVVGTGLMVEYRGTSGGLRWREMRGGIDGFGAARNAANAPVPVLVPSVTTTLTPEILQFASIRNGFALSDVDGAALGGAEAFSVAWHGLLLVENGGLYAFAAGAPTDGTHRPDFGVLRRFHRWRVRLSQGQKSWVVLAHDWPDEEAPPDCAAPIRLDRGFHDLSIEFERLALVIDGPEDLCPQITGFQLKYDGPDSGGAWAVIPNDKLFIASKDRDFLADFDLGTVGDAALMAALRQRYVPTVRDMRATLQRVYKAMLMTARLGLTTRSAADDRHSELDYMLSHPAEFRGEACYRGGGIQVHRVNLDFDLLPWSDNYDPPLPALDQRTAPSPQRMQAWFDLWERLFDYTVMRHATRRSPERPVWLLFHEAAELHEDNPAHLLRHMGVDMRHSMLLTQVFDPAEADLSHDVTSDDLMDDRWAIRVWRADLWLRQLKRDFHPRRIRDAQPYLWASDGPVPDGIANLTKFYRDGCIENGDPRRYLEIKSLNDGLRMRGRQALVAWLTTPGRIAMPWGAPVFDSSDLSALILTDVDAGICQKASRIEDAIGAFQLFINRARLGLEPSVTLSPAFLRLWDSRFGEFRHWQRCKRRDIYRENWIDRDELQKASRSEAFAFLESELRRNDLTLAAPGGLVAWPQAGMPAHCGLTLLQAREPARIAELTPRRQGLGLLGIPDHAARPSWLAPASGRQDGSGQDGGGGEGPILTLFHGQDQGGLAEAPLWFKAAVRLGTRFLRVAAASVPPAQTGFDPKCDPGADGCCCACGKDHPAVMDEYYFWLEFSEQQGPVEQVAEWGALPDDPEAGVIGDPQSDWHRPDRLPGLLRWPAKRTAHLHWCRVHNGEFQPRRQSAEGIGLFDQAQPDLNLTGREGDSLTFSVTGGQARTGHPSDPTQPFPQPGFRYDIAPDDAVLLPEVVTAIVPPPLGGLPAFPWFAWHDPGAPILPATPYPTVVATAIHLSTHCRFDEARRWLDLLWNPLEGDNQWRDCDTGFDGEGEDVPGNSDTGAVDEPEPGGVILRMSRSAASRRRSRRCCCPSEPVNDAIARRRGLTLRQMDLWLDWGDALMRRNRPEAFNQARLLFDTVHTVLGETPTTIAATDPGPGQPISEVQLACAPLNPRLMCLYNRTADRLAMIHACMNARRLRNGQPHLDMEWFGDDILRACWQMPDPCLDDSYWCRPASPYRFEALVARTRELIAETRGLGGQLLSAFEKGDVEYLQAIRSRHERQINDLILHIRENQWRDIDWQVQSLEKAKAMSLTNLTHYRNLITAGLLVGEAQYEPLTTTSTALRTAGNVVEAIGQAMNLIPDPNVGFPVSFLTLPPGKKLAQIFAASGMISRTASDIVGTVSSLGLTKDGWARRETDWQHMVDLYTIEVDKIERDRLAAVRRRDIALRELNNHRQTMQNAAEVQDYLRDKFTGHDLYLWLQQETAALYRHIYDLALHSLWHAERAFNLERGHTLQHFIPEDPWDHLHEGLLAADRLMLALQRMEKTWQDRNFREYEITRHISLREQFPTAFLQLQTMGETEIEVPEWLFDLDYPGQYMRRIKTLALSLPSVTGPYTGIHCRMTLLSSQTRTSPELLDPRHRCCDECGCNNGYPLLPGDSRVVRSYSALDSIVTSVGTDDSGLFQLRFDDPRYLPFEYAGAVCRLRLELPASENRFDMDSLRDVVLHMRYTAREGGNLLRQAARECAQARLPGNGRRLIDARRETPDQWRTGPDCRQLLGLPLSRVMLPFLTGDRVPDITQIEILFEACDARPSTHHDLLFYPRQGLGGFDPNTCAEGVKTVTCIGDAAWPGFYHGVIDLGAPHALMGEDLHQLGVLRFGADAELTGDVWIIYAYQTKDRRARVEGRSAHWHGP